jgi:hypothetical protein
MPIPRPVTTSAAPSFQHLYLLLRLDLGHFRELGGGWLRCGGSENFGIDAGGSDLA